MKVVAALFVVALVAIAGADPGNGAGSRQPAGMTCRTNVNVKQKQLGSLSNGLDDFTEGKFDPVEGLKKRTKEGSGFQNIDEIYANTEYDMPPFAFFVDENDEVIANLPKNFEKKLQMKTHKIIVAGSNLTNGKSKSSTETFVFRPVVNDASESKRSSTRQQQPDRNQEYYGGSRAGGQRRGSGQRKQKNNGRRGGTQQTRSVYNRKTASSKRGDGPYGDPYPTSLEDPDASTSMPVFLGSGTQSRQLVGSTHCAYLNYMIPYIYDIDEPYVWDKKRGEQYVVFDDHSREMTVNAFPFCCEFNTGNQNLGNIAPGKNLKFWCTPYNGQAIMTAMNGMKDIFDKKKRSQQAVTGDDTKTEESNRRTRRRADNKAPLLPTAEEKENQDEKEKRGNDYIPSTYSGFDGALSLGSGQHTIALQMLSFFRALIYSPSLITWIESSEVLCGNTAKVTDYYSTQSPD